MERVERHDLHSRTDFFGIRYFVPPAIRTNSVNDHVFEFEPIVPVQGPKEKFWTELIKSVSAPVVCGSVNKQPSTNLDHLHAVFQGGREVEYVLKRPSVVNRVEPLFQFYSDGLIEIVDEACAFEGGNVH